MFLERNLHTLQFLSYRGNRNSDTQKVTEKNHTSPSPFVKFKERLKNVLNYLFKMTNLIGNGELQIN